MTDPSENGSSFADEHDLAHFAITQRRGCVVITAGGEIDLDTAPRLRDCVKVALTFSPRIVIDLHEVTFLDSSGLSVLVGARNLTRTRHGSIALVGPTGMILKLFDATGLDDVFPTFDQLDDAVDALVGTDAPD